eukprot:1196022-Prorocentrum_minimum.AAC.4
MEESQLPPVLSWRHQQEEARRLRETLINLQIPEHLHLPEKLEEQLLERFTEKRDTELVQFLLDLTSLSPQLVPNESKVGLDTDTVKLTIKTFLHWITVYTGSKGTVYTGLTFTPDRRACTGLKGIVTTCVLCTGSKVTVYTGSTCTLDRKACTGLYGTVTPCVLCTGSKGAVYTGSTFTLDRKSQLLDQRLHWIERLALDCTAQASELLLVLSPAQGGRLNDGSSVSSEGSGPSLSAAGSFGAGSVDHSTTDLSVRQYLSRRPVRARAPWK